MYHPAQYTKTIVTMLKQIFSKTRKVLLAATSLTIALFLFSGSASALSVESPKLTTDSSPMVMHGIRHAQSGRQSRERQYQNNSERKRATRSRSEVVQEVKRRHRGAEVLKVSLNRSGTAYNVRVLMPSGKVRSLKVSASR